MKVTELRIGNWVEWNYEESSDGNAYPVEYGYELDDIENNPNIVKPIPLTEEWLERFGFEKVVNGLFAIDLFHYNLSEYRLYISKNESNEVDFVEVKHVHTIQNLYFALTGEELTKNK